MSWAIETEGLIKRYPRVEGWRGLFSPLMRRRRLGRLATPALTLALLPPAVDGLNLTVREGELFGLLGLNGAGKTTLVKLLCTLVAPTSGGARVLGFDLRAEREIKARIGLAASDERSFYGRLSGQHNLEFFAHLHQIPPAEIPARVRSVLEAVGLEAAASQPFQTYSTGMRQRLSIARALIHRPRLLFLDEPTKGLDPLAARQVQRLVREELVRQEGLTVFLTTHDLEEATQICDRVGIMHHGRLLACGTLPELRAALGGEVQYTLVASGLDEAWPGELAGTLEEAVLDWDAIRKVTALRFRSGAGEGADTDLQRAVESVIAGGGRILEIRQEKLSLDTIFERLVQGGDHRAGETQFGEIHFGTELAAGAAAEPSRRSGSGNSWSEARSPRWSALREAGRTAGAFLKRDLRSEASYRVSFILQFFNIFFQVGVFYFISRLLGPAAAPYLAPYNGDYFSFVLIGIAFAGYFGVGLSSFSNSLRQAQTTGTLEAMLTTPTALPHIIIGSSLWDYLLTTLRVIVYLVLGALLFGANLSGGNYPAALAILILTLVTFSSLGIIAASFIMVLKRGDPITWAFSAVSGLIGGVYYPISVLPAPLQWVARLLPVTYALEGMRLALLNGASFSAVVPHLLALAAFSAVLLPISLASFRYAVRRAKIDGSLTHY